METLTQAMLRQSRPPARAAFPNRLSRRRPLQTIPSLSAAKNRPAAVFHPSAGTGCGTPRAFVKGQPQSWGGVDGGVLVFPAA